MLQWCSAALGEQAALIVQPLVGELAAMVPGSDLDRSWQPAGALRVPRLLRRRKFACLLVWIVLLEPMAAIVVIFELGDDERRIVDAESKSVGIAQHRIAVTGTGGIVVKDRRAQRKRTARRPFHAGSERAFRPVKSAARQIRRCQLGPAKARIDEQVRDVADHKFLSRGELADAQIRLATEFLLDPKIEQARRRRRLDARDHSEILQVGGAELRSVNLMQADVKSRAGPSDELIEVGIHDCGETTVKPLPPLHAADRIPKGIAKIVEIELHAGLFEP